MNAERLADLPRVPPSPIQWAIIQTGLRHAEELGLRLPQIGWRFVTAHGRRGMDFGETYAVDGGARATIFLRVDLNPHRFERTLYHELQHAHDRQAIVDFRYSPAELEQRAEAFADSAMATRP